jgi:hypothetical protein
MIGPKAVRRKPLYSRVLFFLKKVRQLLCKRITFGLEGSCLMASVCFVFWFCVLFIKTSKYGFTVNQ